MAELDFPCLFYDSVIIETIVRRQRVKDESERFVTKLLRRNKARSRHLPGQTKENFENLPELHSVTLKFFRKSEQKQT
jgi:hypothetical protein